MSEGLQITVLVTLVGKGHFAMFAFLYPVVYMEIARKLWNAIASMAGMEDFVISVR